MQSTTLDKIEKKKLIRAPRSRVWNAISKPEEFGKWFGVEITGDFKPGSRVRMVSTHESHKGYIFHIDVDRVEPERLLAWRWQPGDDNPKDEPTDEPDTVVEFRLEDAEGGTLVTITESGFDRLSLARRAAAFDGNEKGWEFQMAALERYAGQA